MGRWHHQREQLIRASGIPATFLRPCGFMTNAFDWLPTLREAGYVLDPIGPGRAAPIDPAYIAAVAALTLTEDGHEGREYLLTGGETFTVAEQVQILAKAIGRDIEVRTVATPAEAVRFRYPNGAPKASRRRPHRRAHAYARGHHRSTQRHRTTPPGTRAADLRRLVRSQRPCLSRTHHGLIQMPTVAHVEPGQARPFDLNLEGEIDA
ncbi:hypothetical protein OG799_32975 [Micromonospora sp. NBC_00898]|uniref:hypothetical protein n=1 Tax=Micromonospora sp. NBC_00898 TaxID=2975981 RepID=UPI003865CD1B|nr:hypothetical protein OG799_32975 [Micromonospora sp. NBC_00898]